MWCLIVTANYRSAEAQLAQRLSYNLAYWQLSMEEDAHHSRLILVLCRTTSIGELDLMLAIACV